MDEERSGRSKGVSSNGGKQARTAWSRLNWSSAKVVAVVQGGWLEGGGDCRGRGFPGFDIGYSVKKVGGQKKQSGRRAVCCR